MEHNDSNLEPGIDAGPSPDAPASGEVASPEAAHAESSGSTETDAGAPAGDAADSADGASAEGDAVSTGPTGPKKRRRGSRGGKNRKKPSPRPTGEGADADDDSDDDQFDDDEFDDDGAGDNGAGDDDRNPELPERASEGKPSPEAAEAAVVRRPQIGDTRPAPAAVAPDIPAAPEQPKPKQRQGQKAQGGQRQEIGRAHV